MLHTVPGSRHVVPDVLDGQHGCPVPPQIWHEGKDRPAFGRHPVPASVHVSPMQQGPSFLPQGLQRRLAVLPTASQ